jgi:hypothetical protein
MTDEERTKMQLRAREQAAEYSYGDSSPNSGRILEVRKARNPHHYPNNQEEAV